MRIPALGFSGFGKPGLDTVRNSANVLQGRPKTKVVFFRTETGEVPVLDWLRELPTKARAKCTDKMERLAELGHELRRSEADLLRDKIYELRASLQGIHYRILYFFHGNTAAVLSHGIVKEKAVPTKEIEKAIERKSKFEANPAKHTHEI
jgi:phage-related protein